MAGPEYNTMTGAFTGFAAGVAIVGGFSWFWIPGRSTSTVDAIYGNS